LSLMFLISNRIQYVFLSLQPLLVSCPSWSSWISPTICSRVPSLTFTRWATLCCSSHSTETGSMAPSLVCRPSSSWVAQFKLSSETNKMFNQLINTGSRLQDIYISPSKIMLFHLQAKHCIVFRLSSTSSNNSITFRLPSASSNHSITFRLPSTSSNKSFYHVQTVFYTRLWILLKSFKTHSSSYSTHV